MSKRPRTVSENEERKCAHESERPGLSEPVHVDPRGAAERTSTAPLTSASTNDNCGEPDWDDASDGDRSNRRDDHDSIDERVNDFANRCDLVEATCDIPVEKICDSRERVRRTNAMTRSPWENKATTKPLASPSRVTEIAFGTVQTRASSCASLRRRAVPVNSPPTVATTAA